MISKNAQSPRATAGPTPLPTRAQQQRRRHTVTLREADASDILRLHRWRNENRNAFFDTSEIDLESHLRWWTRYRADTYRDTQYMVICDDEPVGTIAAIRRGSDTVEIARVVLGEKRVARRGVMAEALRLVMGRYAGADVRFRLHVKADNTAAIGLYKRCGFVVTWAGKGRIDMEA